MIVSLLRNWKVSHTLPAVVPVTRNFRSNALILAKDNGLIPFQVCRIADFHCDNRRSDHVVSSTQQFRPSSIDVKGPEVVYFWNKLKKCFGSKKSDKKKGGKKAKKQSCKKKKCGKQKDTCMKKKDSCAKQEEKKECKTTEGKKEAKKDDPCKKKEEKKKEDPCKKKEEKKKEDPCKKKEEKKKEDPCKKKEEKKKEDPCKKKEEKKDDPCKKKEEKKKEDPCKKKEEKKKEDPCKKKEEKKDDPCKKKEEKKKEDPCKKKEEKKKEDPCKKKEEKKDDPCKKKEDPCKKKDVKKEDPCKKKEEKKDDPCKKKEDPCKKKEEKKKEDPCKKKEEKKKEDPCKKKEDPCKKKEEKKDDPCDPCKKKEDKKEDPCDPCKKKDDPCKKFIPSILSLQDPFLFFARSNSTGKKEEERCSKPCRDPCAEGACDVLPGQDEPCNATASWKIKVRPCRKSSKGESKRVGAPPKGPCMVHKVEIPEQKLEPEGECDLTKNPCGKKVCPNKCDVKRKYKFSNQEEDPKVAVGNLLDLLSYQTRAFHTTHTSNFANARGSVPPSRASDPRKPAAGRGVPDTELSAGQNYSERVSGLLDKLKSLWQGSAPNPGEGGTQQAKSDKARPQSGRRLFGMVGNGAAVAGDGSSQSVSDSHILFLTDDFEKCEDRVPPCPLEPESMVCPAPKDEEVCVREDELWSDIDANWGYEKFPWKSDSVKEERLDEVSQRSDDPYANNQL